MAEQSALAIQPIQPAQPKKAPAPPPAKPTKIELTGWGWPIFWDSMTQNGDISKMLLYPSAGINAYAQECLKWHAGHSTQSSVVFKSAMVECEQHALLILLLKLVVTKGAAKQVAAPQLEAAQSFFNSWQDKLLEGLQTTMAKHQPIQPGAAFYAQLVEDYVLAVHKLALPVNPWFVLYPARHSGRLQALISHAVPKI